MRVKDVSGGFRVQGQGYGSQNGAFEKLVKRIKFLFPMLVSLIVISNAAAIYAQDYREPVDHMTLSGRNDYGSFNTYDKHPKMFHTGMDIIDTPHLVKKYDYTTPVYAVTDGVIYKVFGIKEDGIGYLYRCDNTKETPPNKNADGHDYNGTDNHGFGMTVI